MSRKARIAAVTIGVMGLVVAIGCATALYVAGNVIDEQQIDPEFRLLPLFGGVVLGVLVAIAGLATWIVGYVPAMKRSQSR